ncbi:solute carrier family 35 member F4-like isoform X1 [Alosa pseudoharengus]|uniref:solute carrier family 35 member F4-like isoform X1 n=2 Tax=Alosa pseudoharengus TaxID=34774 RepID=UPI003F8AFBBC
MGYLDRLTCTEVALIHTYLCSHMSQDGNVDLHSAKRMKKHSTKVAPLNSYSTQVLIYPFSDGQEGSESNREISASESSGEDTSYKTFTKTVFKVLGGLLVVLCVSSSLVGTTQLVQLTYESFPCPFFISWFSSNWNIFFFPLYYFGYMSTTHEKQSLIQKFRECSCVFGEEGMTFKLFVKRTAPFSILWTLTNYLHLLALHKLTATDASALYCCHKAFVFLLSWIILKDRFMGIRKFVFQFSGTQFNKACSWRLFHLTKIQDYDSTYS